MNVLIVGCTLPGQKLAYTLEQLGHAVSVLSAEADSVTALGDTHPPFGGLAVVGVPIDVDTLRSAGIEACDAVAAVTEEDNINIMVAQIAKEIFGVKNVIARVLDPDRKKVYSQQFGLRAVCDTNLMVQSVLAGLLEEEDTEAQCVIFGSSTANFSAVPAEKSLFEKPLSAATGLRTDALVFGLQRADGVLDLANIDPVVLPGDKIIYAEIAD
jgi:trk system potassium uptake protein TrkA